MLNAIEGPRGVLVLTMGAADEWAPDPGGGTVEGLYGEDSMTLQLWGERRVVPLLRVATKARDEKMTGVEEQVAPEQAISGSLTETTVAVAMPDEGGGRTLSDGILEVRQLVGKLQDVVDTWRVMRLGSEADTSVEMEGSLEEEGVPEIMVVPFGAPTVENGGGDGADSQNALLVLSALSMDLDPATSDHVDAGESVDSGGFSPDECEDEYGSRYDRPWGYDGDGCYSGDGH
jgi:hypothetical protein